MSRKLRAGVLVSGGGTNLQALLDACQNPAFPAEIVVAGSDNPGAMGLERARARSVPVFTVDYASILQTYKHGPGRPEPPGDFDLDQVLHKQRLFTQDTGEDFLARWFTSRAAAEALLLAEMDKHGVDLVVLAGFMRVLTPYFLDKVNTDPALPRVMNIHPALLPAFPGTDGYGDTFRHGCKVGGCTAHFVDYGEDSGPIIGQRAFAIGPEDTLDTIKEKGLRLEWELYPECVRLFAEGRLSVEETVFKGRIRRITRVAGKGQVF
jgi:phosphoribosylglycinamide formyltransferase-1